MAGQVFVKPVVLFGKRIHHRRVHAQGLAHVTQHAAGAVGGDHGGNGGAVASVFAVDVLDDLFAPIMLKVHINVGRLLAVFADEALEQQVGPGGVHLGNAQAKAHRRIGRRAAPLAQDALAARIAHDVVHRQKVHLVLAVGNQRQLALQLGVHRRRHALRVAAGCAFVGEPGQPLGGCHAGGHGLLRVLVFDFVEAEGAALRNLHRGLQ